MAAIEDEDDEDPALLEESVASITDPEVAKARIVALLNEQQRKQDYHTRLQSKLQKLDALLAQRREDVEGLQRTLQLERSKASEQASSDLRERTQKARMQEERIRDLLSDALFQKPPSQDPREVAEIDTVLVSFIRPNESVRYNLAFRLDADTTVNQLRDNACKYWGVSTDQFVLKTMGNSKCHGHLKVVDCFKHGEISQMRLEYKQSDNTEVAEAELKAIQPKASKKRRAAGQDPRFNKDGVERIQKLGENYAGYLKKMGGIYFLLKVRDHKPSEHAGKIKIHDCFFYLLLAILTLVVYNMRRPAGEAYWCAYGVETAFAVRTPLAPADGAYWSEVPRFDEIRTRDDVWFWLNTTLPDVIWGVTDRNSLRKYNYLPGFVSVRTQSVKATCENCSRWENCPGYSKGLVKQIPGLTCNAAAIEPETEDKLEFAGLRTYWEEAMRLNKTGIRGPAKPFVWKSAKDREPQKVGSFQGKADTYDGSGYAVEYRMTAAPEDYMPLYFSDMENLRMANWISRRSRAVIVSLTTYNFQYDMWVAADFLFEILPCGAVAPQKRILPFKPVSRESNADVNQIYLDVIRLIIGLYILVFVGIAERKHKTKNHKAGFLYHTSLNGIVDIGMVICLFTALIMRLVRLRYGSREYMEIVLKGTGQEGFYSSFELAQVYNAIFTIDGVLFVFVMLRLLSLFRIVHAVYLLWHTFGIAMKPFAFMIAFFIPTFVGFSCLAKSIFGTSFAAFDTIQGTMLQVYNCLAGDLDLVPLLAWDPFWACLFALSFYLLVKVLVLNIYTAIVIDAFYIVRLTTTSMGEAWTARRFLSWAVPSLCVNIFQTFTEPRGAPEQS
eukprot:TRINITY_DN7352_c0_g1_i2.p1 TRINITY_DN7352_c0_g1~~TRINITY_DN7352_c0_g1_i2.p1  ORF type:complete len:839 (-),score=128.42 TRINITY_DN7352_c0_g1_i2:271-2787(-)